MAVGVTEVCMSACYILYVFTWVRLCFWVCYSDNNIRKNSKRSKLLTQSAVRAFRIKIKWLNRTNKNKLLTWMMRFRKGWHHRAGVAGWREKRQEGNIRWSSGISKYETHCVSKHFMFTLNGMLSLHHCSGTDWIYSSSNIPKTIGLSWYNIKAGKNKDNLPNNNFHHFGATSEPSI